MLVMTRTNVLSLPSDVGTTLPTYPVCSASLIPTTSPFLPSPSLRTRDQMCLDSLSDAKEMEHLARRAERRFAREEGAKRKGASKSSIPSTFTDAARCPSTTSNSAEAGSNGKKRQVSAGALGVPTDGVVNVAASGGEGGGTKEDRLEEEEEEEDEALEENGEEEEEEEEPWGVVLRNTIIRDLAGFGIEHAGPIGRSLISKVMSVSQDNYPEMVRIC